MSSRIPSLLSVLALLSLGCGPQHPPELDSPFEGLEPFTEWSIPSLDLFVSGERIVARDGDRLLEGEALMRRCAAAEERDATLLARQALDTAFGLPATPVSTTSHGGGAGDTVVAAPSITGDDLRFFVFLERSHFEYSLNLVTMETSTRPAEEVVAERQAREVVGEARCGLEESCGCWRPRCGRFTPVQPEGNQRGNHRQRLSGFYTYQNCVEDCEGGTCALYCHDVLSTCTASCQESPPAVQCVEDGGRCELQDAPRTHLIPREPSDEANL